VIVVDTDDHDHDHDDHVIYYNEDEGIDGGGHTKKKGRRGKKGRKKNKIHYKKAKPYIYAFAGMKLLLYHLLLKKFAFFSMASFFLSKISFILASLVALKQFFNTPTHHRSSDSNKVEVVHIPIRKEKKSHKYHQDDDWEESRFIPITFAPDGSVYDTTALPYINYNYGNIQQNQQDFNDSQEEDDDSDRNLNEVYPDNHQQAPFQPYQSYSDKKIYPNRVNAAFL
jgi:hypothetical protein